MKKTDEYKQCEEVIDNADNYSKLYYAEAVKFITAYKEGYKSALSINAVVECKHGDREAVYFKEGDFAYVICNTCKKVVE